MHFIDTIRRLWKERNTLLCVGLDPEPERFPAQLRGAKDAILQFNRAIVDATADLVCAYKPQIAHYAAHSAEDQLAQTIDYIHERCPGVPVILDSKRGDIGNTASMYAREAFERFKADAATVNPYLGFDSIEPFLRYEGKGVVLLCRTSNPSARDFQDLDCGGKTLYEAVAERAAHDWNGSNNLMLVVGATYPNELARIRAITGNVPFLVPGVGAQGGSARDAVVSGKTADGGDGVVISASRSILYAGDGADFADRARAAAQALVDEINAARR